MQNSKPINYDTLRRDKVPSNLPPYFSTLNFVSGPDRVESLQGFLDLLL